MRRLPDANTTASTPSKPRRPAAGLGQLSLVEHALCPLDAARPPRAGRVFVTSHYYADRNRHRRQATVRVACPGGLFPADEFYLWGLLALTVAAAPRGGDPDPEFHATPHYCLRRLGLIDQHTRRGGRQYRQFAAALDRLAQVSYASDAFYDPVRGEHRRVRFGFLSYSLPHDPDSSRAWRVAWDPVFFDLVTPPGGHLRFDLDLYRSLDPAARRLFLLVSKIFARRDTTPRFDVRHLAVDVLGFAPTLAPRHQRQKVQRVVADLAAAGVVAGPAAFEPAACGRSQSVVLTRGPYFLAGGAKPIRDGSASPLWDGLVALGFDRRAAARLLREYPQRAVREWLDITLAARERFGAGFFTRSPLAYLVDNLRASASSGRTPPDWWHELRTREQERPRPRPPRRPEAGPDELNTAVPDHTAAILRRVADAVLTAPPAGHKPPD